ncbi:MAG: hypothetical protein VCD33_13570 [Alphaproteobacteria bacterium]
MDEQVKRKAEIIEPPESRVKLRADFDGFKIDEAALARAEIVIESMGNDYLARAADEIRNLDDLYAAALGTDGNRDEMIGEVAIIAHNLMGNGTSFGYDLMTAIGASLYDFCRSADTIGNAQFDVIRVHIGALKVVVDGNLKGDGGERGAEMVAMLQRAARLRQA